MVFANIVLWFMLHREHASQLCDVRVILLSQFYRPLAPCMMYPFTVCHFINTSIIASKVHEMYFLEAYATCIWMTILFSIYFAFILVIRTSLMWIQEVLSTGMIKSEQFLRELDKLFDCSKKYLKFYRNYKRYKINAFVSNVSYLLDILAFLSISKIDINFYYYLLFILVIIIFIHIQIWNVSKETQKQVLQINTLFNRHFRKLLHTW